MSQLDLRPLSLGEILDRSFTLYRRHFLLFTGITAVPQILVLVLNLLNLGYSSRQNVLGIGASTLLVSAMITLFMLAVAFLAYLVSQGATILAVTDLYLGRSASISDSFRRVRGELLTVFGVASLNGIAVLGAGILLVIPGIYVACRFMVSLPAAMIEGRGPSESLSRSWELTAGSAGRAFVILLLGVILAWCATLLLAVPFEIAGVWLAHDSAMKLILLALTQVGSTLASILVAPVPLIATSIFYFDLRVRKEAFDLQFMMNPMSEGKARPAGPPSIL